MDKIRWRVFIARGHTIVHLPQSRHPLSRFTACCCFPFCRARIALRTLVLVNLPAVQLAVQLPQAIHLSTSGSAFTSSANFSLQALSRSILELGFRVNPNFSITWFCSLHNCGLQVLQKRPHSNCREEFLDLCMLLQRKLRVSGCAEAAECCPGFQRNRHFHFCGFPVV